MKTNIQNEYYCIRKTSKRVDKSIKTIYTFYLDNKLDSYAFRLHNTYNYSIQYEII